VPTKKRSETSEKQTGEIRGDDGGKGKRSPGGQRRHYISINKNQLKKLEVSAAKGQKKKEVRRKGRPALTKKKRQHGM